MLTTINNTGGNSSCYSYDNTRYGASAIIGKTTPIQAYSVSGTSVSTWDVKGVNTSGTFISSDTAMTWDQANIACSTAGGRLPTVEELETLSLSSYKASINTSYTPPSFVADTYWSSTTVPSTPANAYIVDMNNGNVSSNNKTGGGNGVRCIR